MNTKADVDNPDHDSTTNDVTMFLESLHLITRPYGIERWRKYLRDHDGFFTSWDWLAKFERSRPDHFAWCPVSHFGFYYDGKTGMVANGSFNIEAMSLARAQVTGLPTLFVHREVSADGIVLNEGGLFAGVWPCGWNRITVQKLNYPGDSWDECGEAARQFFEKMNPQIVCTNVIVSGSGDPYCRVSASDLVSDWPYEIRTQLRMVREQL